MKTSDDTLGGLSNEHVLYPQFETTWYRTHLSASYAEEAPHTPEGQVTQGRIAFNDL